MRYKRGFTLAETLVVVGVIVLLASLITQPFKNFRDSQVLAGSAEEILSTLGRARAQTLAGLNDSIYGVHFESDRLIIFAGSSYQVGVASNETILLNQLTTISSINLTGGSNEVLFQHLTGETLSTGTITVSLVQSSGQTKTISILSSGIAGVN